MRQQSKKRNNIFSNKIQKAHLAKPRELFFVVIQRWQTKRAIHFSDLKVELEL